MSLIPAHRLRLAGLLQVQGQTGLCHEIQASLDYEVSLITYACMQTYIHTYICLGFL